MKLLPIFEDQAKVRQLRTTENRAKAENLVSANLQQQEPKDSPATERIKENTIR